MTDLIQLIQSLLVGMPLQQSAGQQVSLQHADVDAALLDDAQQQGMAVVLYDLLHRNGIDLQPVRMRDVLKTVARRETAIELARYTSTRNVLGCMRDAGIEVLLLKGSALAYWLYENPAQRSRCDLDILVADVASAERAITALVEAGYAPSLISAEDSADFETALERALPGGLLHRVDLHWQLLNHARLAQGLLFKDLWAASIDIPALDCQARGLGVVHALLHALLHRVTNMPSGQHDRLIWLYDIHLLAHMFREAEWTEFVHACSTLRCATPCLDGLQASQHAFQTVLPARVESSLRAQLDREDWQLGLGSALDQGAMDRSHLEALTARGKLQWLRRKLFPPRAFMRYRYGGPDGMGLFHAYLYRWWVGVKRGLGGR